jgi:NTE family protein
MVWLFSSIAFGNESPPVDPVASRPKIGLVLGGGGALGLAHVGVLKVLEEQRVPIDCIVGTSMGSIIAGLYASGMSPDEIQTLLEKLDWDDIMNDRTSRRELFFRRKLDDQRFLFEVGVGRGGFRFGAGMAAGQKFNNMMEVVTLRASYTSKFDELPIPYRAVATDLIAGEAYNMSSGRLSRAMRASMAVPGVFTPVEKDGRILVDGGIVNNLPVDVAKAMGADIVIAVDVGASADRVDPNTLRTLGGVIGRSYTIAQRPQQMENFRRADIGIQPELDGMTASQFTRVREFIPRGEAAANNHAAELSRYSVDKETFAAVLARQRRPKPILPVIDEIRVSGNERVSEAIIRGRIRTKVGSVLDPSVVDEDLRRIFGIGEFEQVLFNLDNPEDGDAVLYFDAKERPSGPTYFRYGLRLESDFDNDANWAMLLNLTRMSLNSLGAEWRNELEVGTTQNLFTEFYQPLNAKGIYFVAPSAEYKSELENIYAGEQRIAEFDVNTLAAYLDAGIQLRQHAEFRVGPFWGTGNADVKTGAADLPNIEDDISGFRARLALDRKDRTIFAREGYQFYLQGHFVSPDLGGDAEYDKLESQLHVYHSTGDHTFSGGLQGGTSLNSDLPGYAQFTMGGPFSFAGLAEEQFRGSYLGIASVGYRYRIMRMPAQLGRGVYAVTRIDYGNVWVDEFDVGDMLYGGLVGMGADTSVGPILISYGQAEGGYDRFYFSLGTSF